MRKIRGKSREITAGLCQEDDAAASVKKIASRGKPQPHIARIIYGCDVLGAGKFLLF